jgi:hypothetical protein
MIRTLLLALLLSGPAQAQVVPEGQAVEEYDPDAVEGVAPDEPAMIIPDVPANDVRALSGSGVELKGLDKVSGEVLDLKLGIGEPGVVGRLEVTAGQCRYPEDNPAGEGYAWLTIRDPQRDAVLFEGWMVASSPALNALDHPRYDIWVIRCTTA